MLIKEVLDSIARAYQWRNFDVTNMQPPDASLPQQEVIKVPLELVKASIGQYRLMTKTPSEYSRKNSIYSSIGQERARPRLSPPRRAECFVPRYHLEVRG
jgi:hypothetical protein